MLLAIYAGNSNRKYFRKTVWWPLHKTCCTSCPTGQNCVWTWWRHQMETFSALHALCAGNSPVNGEFLVQRPVTRSFGVFFDLRLNKRSSKQSWGWWLDAIAPIMTSLMINANPASKLSHNRSCEGNPRPVMRCFDVSLNMLLNKQWISRWFETPWGSCDVTVMSMVSQLSAVDMVLHIWFHLIFYCVLLRYDMEMLCTGTTRWPFATRRFHRPS